MNLINETIRNLNEKNHNLIIIGNGFDLHCDLKTDYETYFNKRVEHLRSLDGDIVKLLLASEQKLSHISYQHILLYFSRQNVLKDMNAWDIVFFTNFQDKKQNWCDIEKTMYQFLTDTSHKNSISKVYSGINDLIKENDFSLWNKTIHKSNYFISSFIISKHNLVDEIKLDDLYLLLLDELKIFESTFSQFIKNQRSRSKYYSKAHHLLESINYSNNNYMLLNFNYTLPQERYSKPGYEKILLCENVHGNIKKGSIIFGIDHSELNSDEKVYLFSKTARKIFYSDTYNETTALLIENTENIIIYGHSLNDADISYYISIFDYHNLYSSKINLIFYYSIYDKNKEIEIKTSRYNEIIHLINAYGVSLGQHKGKNLLHKLLLENRLHIVELKHYSKKIK